MLMNLFGRKIIIIYLMPGMSICLRMLICQILPGFILLILFQVKALIFFLHIRFMKASRHEAV